MNLLEKLLQIQISIDAFLKDGENKSDKYKYVSSDMVLDTIRPKMNELKLLLEPSITGHGLHTGETKSGTTRFMTEIDVIFTWIDVESGETRAVPFYAQGVDLAGEKGVGKALTYSEKYFLMKYFHVPTSKDDPDSDGRTGKGDKPLRGTQAAAETAAYMREAIMQMLNDLYAGDMDKMAQALVVFTKNDARQFAGHDSIDKITDAALGAVYAKAKSAYKKRKGADFVFVPKDEGGGDS